MKKKVVSKVQVSRMKRTVDISRRPDPLMLDVETESVKDKVVDLQEKLSEQGCHDFIYQARCTAPPIDDYNSIVGEVEDNSVYINVVGSDGERRYSERFSPEYVLESSSEFDETVGRIDEIIDDREYDLRMWRIGGVSTSASSGDGVVDELDGLELSVLADVDAGLESQTGQAGFQPISIGWYRKAPMNPQMEFGYRAFTRREFEHDEEKDYDSGGEIIYDLVGRITGERDDEINNHYLLDEEVEVLRELEIQMQEKNLL